MEVPNDFDQYRPGPRTGQPHRSLARVPADEHEPLPLTSEQVEAMAIAARMHLDCPAHEYYRLEARLSERLASIACVEA